jgi:hypothetical protein
LRYLKSMWVHLCALIIVISGGFAAGALAGPVLDLSGFPDQDIQTFDRIDFSWTHSVEPADYYTVEFGDGQSVTLDASVNKVRHHYMAAGSYDVTVTAWADDKPASLTMPAMVDVQGRTIPGENVMFLHHSTGRNMLTESGFRSLVNAHNSQSDIDIRFWDHDYHSGNSYTGVILPDSTVHHDWSYGVQANIIQPYGYQEIFVQAPAFRDSLFSRHEVIIFKNDHRTGDIETDEELAEHKAHYLEVRDILDQFPDKLFVMMSGPPRRPEEIAVDASTRARDFYNWAQSPEFLSGHPNILYFDFFDMLAYPNDPSDPERNMLRAEFRRTASWDNHPNVFANTTCGPIFADFLLRLMDPDFFSDPTTPVHDTPAAGAVLHGAVPNPFNPATTISWELPEAADVTLVVYDVAGRKVRTLIDRVAYQAGTNGVMWRGNDDSGRSQPSGVYFYQLSSGVANLTKRMTLVR